MLRIVPRPLRAPLPLQPPGHAPDSNKEGIAIAPESECVRGHKSFFWSDDDDYGGHAIYRGSIPCGALP